MGQLRDPQLSFGADDAAAVRRSASRAEPARLQQVCRRLPETAHLLPGLSWPAAHQSCYGGKVRKIINLIDYETIT